MLIESRCLFGKVLMKDIVTPVRQDEVKTAIRDCLEQAALVNYQRLSEYAKLEGKLQLHHQAVSDAPPNGWIFKFEVTGKHRL